MTITELSPATLARVEALNRQHLEICAPFDALTPAQRNSALNFFVGYLGAAAMRGDQDAAGLIADALKAARRVK